MKPEFKIDDIVTFNANGTRIKAKVKTIKHGMAGNNLNLIGLPDNRVFYELSGVDKPLKTTCSGLCIVESVFYSFVNSLHEDAMEKLTGEWQRPKEFTDRPEVVRDLLEYGYIECKHVVKNSKTNETICFYRS